MFSPRFQHFVQRRLGMSAAKGGPAAITVRPGDPGAQGMADTPQAFGRWTPEKANALFNRDTAAPAVTTQPPRRGMGGVFGRMGLTGDRIALIGAGLRDDPNAFSETLAAQQDAAFRRDMLGMRARQQKLDTSQEEQSRSDLERFIAGLPPDQQAIARASPEAYVRALIERQRGGSEWQHGQGYSHAFRVNPDGTVTRGDELPLRPRQGVGANAGDYAEDWEAF